MSLSMGIVGLPNVGKSTLFNALTKKSVPAENYPFCTIDPSVGVVAVPDDRLYKLGEISSSAECIPAATEFVDIAGLVAGAAEGEGLGNKFLSHIREVDAICHVVRIFEDSNVHHVEGNINPLRDISVINLELVMADISTVSKRLEAVSKEVKRGDKDAKVEAEVLNKLHEALESEKLASVVDLSEEEEKIARGLHLLTKKPMLYVLNRQAGGTNIDEDEDKIKELLEFFKETGTFYVVVDASVENEVSSLDSKEKAEIRNEFGVEESGVDALIRKAYETLDLISFFTTGEKESRAWAVKKGSTAPEAGAAIHSDFRDNFIKAMVIAYDRLVELGGMATAREKGLLRTEGKEYIVQDGDVIEFKI